MTAYGSEEVAVQAMKSGADDYIAKGRLQIDELEMRIAQGAASSETWKQKILRCAATQFSIRDGEHHR